MGNGRERHKLQNKLMLIFGGYGFLHLTITTLGYIYCSY